MVQWTLDFTSEGGRKGKKGNRRKKWKDRGKGVQAEREMTRQEERNREVGKKNRGKKAKERRRRKVHTHTQRE